MKEKNLNEYRENLAKDLKDLKGTNPEMAENERQQVRKEILSKLTLEAQNDLENVKFDFYGLTLGEKTKQEVLEELKKNNHRYLPLINRKFYHLFFFSEQQHL